MKLLGYFNPYPKAQSVTEGRRAGSQSVLELRSLADRIERLALTDAAETLVLLEPFLDDLRRQSELALERALDT